MCDNQSIINDIFFSISPRLQKLKLAGSNSTLFLSKHDGVKTVFVGTFMWGLTYRDGMLQSLPRDARDPRSNSDPAVSPSHGYICYHNQ